MKLIFSLIPWQFVRFGIVGTGGFLVDYAMLRVFEGLGLDPYNGQIVAFCIAAIFTWLFNRLWTFRAHRSLRTKRNESIRYFLAVAIGASINYSAYAVLITFSQLCRDHNFFAVAAGSIAGLCFNFPASRFFVFRPVVNLPAEPASPPDR